MPQAIFFQMRIPFSVREEAGVFYSSCTILDVHSQGATKDEALDNLTEAIQLFVETCYESGSLENVLKHSGFTPAHLAMSDQAEGDYMDVPLSLVAQKHAQDHAY